MIAIASPIFSAIAAIDIDFGPRSVDAAPMEVDDAPKRPSDALAELVREDLDRLSVAELHARVASLEGEIVRCRQKIERAVNHRASADALFRR
jgi:uncharacterized small protein (DUF1192 family)